MYKDRKYSVPGLGSSVADIMMIGEGPGFHENNQGKPFVGPAGIFLDELLSSIYMIREDIFITNILKCRAPKNRDPLVYEIQSCNKHLDKQIKVINPALIVTLGRFSTAKFLPRISITDARGKLYTVHGRFVFPIFHPAASLYDTTKKPRIQQDFNRIPDILQKSIIPVAPVSIQGTLF